MSTLEHRSELNHNWDLRLGILSRYCFVLQGKHDSNPIVDRFRRKRQRLPSSVVIESAVKISAQLCMTASALPMNASDLPITEGFLKSSSFISGVLPQAGRLAVNWNKFSSCW